VSELVGLLIGVLVGRILAAIFLMELDHRRTLRELKRPPPKIEPKTFRIGNLYWDGHSLAIRGSLTEGAGDGPD